MSLEYVKYFNLFGEEVAQVPSILGNGKPQDQIDNTLVQRAEPGCLYMDRLSGDLYKQIEPGQWKIVGGGVLVTDPGQNGNIIFESGEPGENGGSIKGAVLYTEQVLTDEQKTQARNNINALGYTDDNEYEIPCGNRNLSDVASLMLSGNQVPALSINASSARPEAPAVLYFYDSQGDAPVILHGVENGINDKDAINLGQLNSVVGNISTAFDYLIALQEALIEDLTLITFTIDDRKYIAEDGMTWTEWCASSYNFNGFYIDSDGYVCDQAGDRLAYNVQMPSEIPGTATIHSSYDYFVQ